MTHPPVSCPVCGRLIVEPVLKSFRLTAEGEGLVRDVHAMKAFHCQEQGHIFFIRVSDLEAEPLQANA